MPVRSASALTVGLLLSAGIPFPAFGQAQAPPGADLRLVKCEEERIGSLPGTLLLHLTVKNAGSGESIDATLHAKFFGADGTFLDEATVPLDNGRVGPGAEDAFTVTVLKCPDYRRLASSLFWTTAVIPMTGNDFSKEPRLETGEFVFARCSNGDLVVTGKLRNGLATAAADVEVTLALKNEAGIDVTSVTRRFEGVIPAGARMPFRQRIRECPAVASFTPTVTGKELDGAGAGEAGADAGLHMREKGLAAGAVREKASSPAAAPGAAPAGDGGEPGPAAAIGPAAEKKDAGKDAPEAPSAAPAYAIRVDGLAWVNGTYKTVGTSSNYKYTGDTAFLKLTFADVKGAPARPEATVVVKVTDRGQSRGFCKRTIAKGSWKLNADALNADNAAPEVVAFSAKDGALWVGLVRMDDSQQADFALDISVEIKKQGAWTWKGLRDPFRTLLAPPDPAAAKKGK